MLVEYARNVLGIEDADHAESSPDAARAVVTPLSCSLVGLEGSVRLVPGTRAAALYGRAEAVESYYCNYGLNAEYRAPLEEAGLCVSGVGDDDEVRVVEIPSHPFFLATLFIPQVRSTASDPHPVVRGFARAARDHAASVAGAASA